MAICVFYKNNHFLIPQGLLLQVIMPGSWPPFIVEMQLWHAFSTVFEWKMETVLTN